MGKRAAFDPVTLAILIVIILLAVWFVMMRVGGQNG